MRQSYKLLKDKNGVNHLVSRETVDAFLAKHRPKTKSMAYKLPDKVERGSWIWDGKKLVERHLYRGRGNKSKLQVIKDIEPFLNIAVDNKPIGSRRQKRDMMRAYGLEEVGNERPQLRQEQPETYREKRDRVEDIKQAYRQHGVDIL